VRPVGRGHVDGDQVVGALEFQARQLQQLWRGWGSIAKHAACGAGGSLSYCRRVGDGRRWLCCEWFGTDAESRRLRRKVGL
jgi:hypothetical protein